MMVIARVFARPQETVDISCGRTTTLVHCYCVVMFMLCELVTILEFMFALFVVNELEYVLPAESELVDMSICVVPLSFVMVR